MGDGPDLAVESQLPASRLRCVKAHIDENLQGALTLEELSAVVHMSAFHFARLFKRSTGVPPHRFVIQRRVDQARALLAMPTISIAEIARSVGFSSPSHFATTFRRVVGVTPSQYRGASAETREASA